MSHPNWAAFSGGTARADEILDDFERRKERAGIRCVTPVVLETIAVKRT